MVQRTAPDSMTQETVLDGVPRSPHDEHALGPGDSVGRYVILGRVGSGGMGVVYSAYDPELDRKVALKLLHRYRTQAHSRSDGRSRLLREAQAMAKLSHPNVVTVHDVGLHDDRVFLAMEYVEGKTLGAYMKRGPHPWRDVLDLFLAAGRGLAAAHEAGLVHRDFKPDNVLIREDGVVKVTDFGLARERTTATRAKADAAKATLAADGAAAEDATEASMTRTGRGQGTPAYMSPEQHLGLPTDPSTDQFSFCVALYEGVYGQAPFGGEGRAALALAVTEGEVREPPSGSRVPGWLREVILRGLRPQPVDRYASMLTLLDALSKDPSAGRRRVLGWIAAATVVGIAGFGLASIRRAETELCSNMERHLAGVWDAEARERLRVAIDAAEVGFADSTYARVETALDRYAGEWVEQRRESCEATQLRGEQSQTLMDRRMACLDGRLQDLDSLVDVLSVGDADVVQKAVEAVGELPDLAHCADTVALSAEVAPPDAAVAEKVSKLRGRLAQARALSSAGQYEPGLAVAVDVVETARELGYPPLLVEALDRLGRLQHATGADKEAEATLEEAFFLAVRERLDDPAGRAASELVKVVGKSQARSADGRKWASHAQAHAAAAGDELIRAAAIMGLANVAHQESNFEEAKALAEEVLAIHTAQLGDKHAGLLPALNLLGLVASDTGKFDEATAYYTRGLELGREILGPDHPDLARFLNNLAKIAWLQGKLDDAEKSFQLALDLQKAALGPEHRNVAQLHNNLAAVAASRGDMEEAGRRFKLALDIWVKALGPEHPSVADGLNNMAVVASALKRYEESRDYDERALAIRQRTMEADHPAIAQNLNNLGEDLRHLGDLEGALELHRKSLEIYEKKLGPEHDDVAGALTAIAYDLVLLGRAAEAVTPAQRALEIRLKLELDPMERANSKWTLALALWQSPRPSAADRRRARELAKEALVVFESGDSEFTEAAKAWVDHNG